MPVFSLQMSLEPPGTQDHISNHFPEAAHYDGPLASGFFGTQRPRTHHHPPRLKGQGVSLLCHPHPGALAAGLWIFLLSPCCGPRGERAGQGWPRPLGIAGGSSPAPPTAAETEKRGSFHNPANSFIPTGHGALSGRAGTLAWNMKCKEPCPRDTWTWRWFTVTARGRRNWSRAAGGPVQSTREPGFSWDRGLCGESGGLNPWAARSFR